MRKFYFLLLFTTLFFSSSAQDGLYQFTNSYFKPNPFQGEFSSFLKKLTTDVSLKDTRISPRTDSSLFFFVGTYKNHNPFFFIPKRIDVLLEEMAIKYADTATVTDTVLVYELMAFTEGDKKGIQEVKKEFEKIHRQYNKKFVQSNFIPLQNDKVTEGGAHNYFSAFSALAPLTVSWGRLKSTNETVLNITLRFKKIENQAVLP
jgi:hypothetical protein